MTRNPLSILLAACFGLAAFLIVIMTVGFGIGFWRAWNAPQPQVTIRYVPRPSTSQNLKP